MRHGGATAATSQARPGGRREPPSGLRWSDTRTQAQGEVDISIGQSIGDIGEFALVARIAAGLRGAPVATTLLGPGDDAAVVAARDGRVVVTTDVLIEGGHFRRDWSSAEDVGHKAAAKNFADIAAMGAVPTALVVGFGAPADLPLSWVDGLVTGLREAVGALGADVVGGDVIRSEKIIVSATALGDLQSRAPVRMSGAAKGDVVAVAGRLGWAAAGFAVLGRGFRSPVQMVAAHRRPEPPYASGPQAADAGASSMTDVSDGLIGDLSAIAAASGVRIDLNSSAFVIPAKLAEVASALNVDPLTWIMTGGDDYALVATFPPHTQAPEGFTRVGVVSEGEGVRVDGRRWPQGGHEHFR